MDYILTTYYRHLILRIATPENQMPGPSLIIQAAYIRAKAPQLVRGESDSAYQMTFSPLGPLGFLNAEHGATYLQLVGNNGSQQVCIGACCSFTIPPAQRGLSSLSILLTDVAAAVITCLCTTTWWQVPKPRKRRLKIWTLLHTEGNQPHSSHFPGSTPLCRLHTRRGCSLSLLKLCLLVPLHAYVQDS